MTEDVEVTLYMVGGAEHTIDEVHEIVWPSPDFPDTLTLHHHGAPGEYRYTSVFRWSAITYVDVIGGCGE